MTPPAARRVPRLRYRPTALPDLDECFELMPAWLGLDAALRDRLRRLWDSLVDQPAVLTGVMEDMALPLGQRIQAWGVTMALRPAQVQALALDSGPHAHVTRRIYASLIDGSQPPMSDREIGLLNARGELVLMILHFSQRQNDLSDPYVSSVIAIANDTFRAFHDGYQLRAFFYETSAEVEPIASASGFLMRRYVDEDSLQALRPALRPTLMGLTREEARTRLPGAPARNTFEHQPPMFRFSASQRRLLWLSLFDDSDEHLMQALDVSIHGLKKLWRGVYERIEDVAPDFFGEAAGDNEGRRGPEKRRQVLAYVRQRPEELRPWAEHRA
ncbi:MAG: hypothetical protein IV097_04120 [Burkholderiaceae bacterium]|nr:hypothetical protein [Burkholderiaceae bacterium]